MKNVSKVYHWEPTGFDQRIFHFLPFSKGERATGVEQMVRKNKVAWQGWCLTQDMATFSKSIKLRQLTCSKEHSSDFPSLRLLAGTEFSSSFENA